MSQSSKTFVIAMVCLFSNYSRASDMICFPNEDLNECLKRQTVKKVSFTKNETCLGTKKDSLAFLGICADSNNGCQSGVSSSSLDCGSSSICCQVRLLQAWLNLNRYLTYTLICRLSEKINLWSKAIIKLKPFQEAPNKKLGVQNDRLGRQKLFTLPKKWKWFLKVMGFCKTFWEIFDFF